jgi:uncharacterized protein
MAVSMYTISAPVFVQILEALSNVLGKAKKHCEENKLDESFFMSDRFYPNMFPLVRQVRAACDHALNACARIADAEGPAFANEEKTLADLQERIATTVAFVKSIKPEQMDGREDKEIVFTLPSGERRFTGQAMLLNFTMPNFYFHATTAYDLLRHRGVVVGKRDFMGTPWKPE